mgnify:CR=1 FL=1
MRYEELKGSELEFGNVTMECENIPVIEIHIKETGQSVGWLAPFRAYSFQVSGSPTGQIDLGSTNVVGLCNCIIDDNDRYGYGYNSNLNAAETSKEFIAAMAALAVNQFASNHKFIVPSCKWTNWDFVEEHKDWSWINVNFSEFVEKTFQFLKALKDENENENN